MIKGSTAQRNEGLRIIYRQNKDAVCSYIMANNGGSDEAKDVFQEAVIAFYENVMDGKFKGESAISTYLYSIGKFKWLNQIKKNQIRKGHYKKLENDPIFESPLASIIEGENRQGVLAILTQLGATCKKLLVENIYHNSSMKEIAESGNFSSEQIVRNKKYKCLKKLKELIAARPAMIKVLMGNE